MYGAPDPPLPARDRREYLALQFLTALIGAALVVYSQTTAFTWDEGFHLLAAQLIGAGKNPYLDFCFPQAPLNAYWTAGWMRIFGESWRTAHALSAVLTAAAVWLVSDFVYSRMPASPWRLPAAVSAALLMGLNNAVFEYGAIGQAYGICIFGTVAAFRLCVRGVGEKGWVAAGGAGFFAGAAADSSLLAAAAAPVLLLWTVARNRKGNRAAKAAAFLCGALLAFLPVIRLFALAPQSTLFNLFQYQVLYRTANWRDPTGHDLEVLTSWIDSGAALLLVLLAAAGVLFVRAGKRLEGPRRSEFYLCAWLAAALAMESGFAHPTFGRYFALAVPFAAMLAGAGFFAAGSALTGVARPVYSTLGLALLLLIGWGKCMHARRDVYTWNDMEQIARKVRALAPPRTVLWADEPIYFLNRRIPPDGMEFSYSHLVESLPMDRARMLHILPRSEITKRVGAGAYDVIETCDDGEDFMTSLNLAGRYRHREEVSDCAVYWDKVSKPGK